MWDFTIKSGICAILSGVAEAVQQAGVASFLNYGGVPQLPNVGVPWTDLLTNQTSMPVVNSSILSNLATAGLSQFSPQYGNVGGKVSVNIQNQWGSSQ